LRLDNSSTFPRKWGKRLLDYKVANIRRLQFSRTISLFFESGAGDAGPGLKPSLVIRIQEAALSRTSINVVEFKIFVILIYVLYFMVVPVAQSI
jgi:hypothetical protein